MFRYLGMSPAACLVKRDSLQQTSRYHEWGANDSVAVVWKLYHFASIAQLAGSIQRRGRKAPPAYVRSYQLRHQAIFSCSSARQDQPSRVVQVVAYSSCYL